MSILFNTGCEIKRAPGVDQREPLFNDGTIGTIQQISVPTELITSLKGILFDLDPQLYHQSSVLPVLPFDPKEFFVVVGAPWLRRHPVLAKAEVRNSGRGLHGLLRFAKPVIFTTPGDRDRWSGIVQVVQAALPIDPDQPGITAMTRPIGGINSKNGAAVELLAAGEPVTTEEVMSLYRDMTRSPFKTVAKILTGVDCLTPCPICCKAGSSLKALDRVGKCYGSCGSVQLFQLYDLALAPRNSTAKEVTSDGTDAK